MKRSGLHAFALAVASIVACKTGGGAPAGKAGVSMDPGAKVAEAGEEGDAVLTHTFDLTAIAQLRDNWFVFRDRRPDLYGTLVTLHGDS